MNYQLRPWICKHRPKSSLNFVKYQFRLWISLTSIKMVPPSKRLWCPVHVSKRKPCVQGLNWWKRKKFSFHFSNPIFSAFPYLPCFILTFHPQISVIPIKTVLDLSPLQNYHHRRRSTMSFWRTKRSLVKVSLTSITPSPPVRFHHFFGLFFIFVFSFDEFVFILNDFVLKFSVFCCCLD